MKKTLLTLFSAGWGLAAMAQLPTLVYDLNPGAADGDPACTTPYNGKLYMIANDGVHGSELFSYDGVGNPTLQYDLNPGMADGALGGIYNRKLAILNNKLYFSGNNGSTGMELYQFDGVSAPTLAADINTGASSSSPDYMATYGSRILFAATASSGTEMYIYNGAGAPVLFDINPGTTGSYPHLFTGYNGKVYFAADNGTNGVELHVYDTTTNTRTMVTDLYTGSEGSNPLGLMVIDSKLYFSAVTDANGRELYSYDGTVATRVTDVAAGMMSGLYSDMGYYNNFIFFGGSTDGSAFQLYKFNPADGTTSLVYTINPTGNSSPSRFLVYNGKMYFLAADVAHGKELWVYDGTTTSLVADIYPGTGSSNITDMQVWNNTLYMQAQNGTNGYELFALKDATGVQNTKFNGSIALYPNPTNGDCTLALNLQQAQQLNVTVSDVTGRQVYSTGTQQCSAAQNNITIPLHTMAAGTYFYHIYSADGMQAASGKMVRE